MGYGSSGIPLTLSQAYRGNTVENVWGTLRLDHDSQRLLAFGSERLGLFLRKKGLAWSVSIPSIRCVDLVSYGSTCPEWFIRVATSESDSSNKSFLVPVSNMRRGIVLWMYLSRLAGLIDF